MSRTRRYLLPVLGALALTVALAWAGAVASNLTGSTFQHAPGAGELAGLRVYVPGDWTPRTWLVRRGPGLRHDLLSECIWMGSTLGASPSTAPNRTMHVVSAGWPLPALQWTTYPKSEATGALARAWDEGIPITRQRTLITGDLRRLPLRPVWAGLVADVALSAGGFVLGSRWLARRRGERRRDRGDCEACGYHLAGLGKCPECGSPAAAGNEGTPAPAA